MHLSQIQQKLGDWQDRTFGVGPERHIEIIHKLDEELGELEAIHDGTAHDCSREALRMELADLVTLCMIKAHLEKIDLESAILEKFNINRNRKWSMVDGVWKGSK